MIRITSAEPLPDYRLKVTFNDGLGGIYNVDPAGRGGGFLKLLDKQVFDAVTIDPDFGCIQWEGGIDLCPTMMYHEMAAGQPGESRLLKR